MSVARGAGLRYQGLTFSYLVLFRSTGENAAENARARSVASLVPGALAGGVIPARALSGPRGSKGKTEVFVCAPVADGGTKLMELDRDKKRTPEGALRVDAIAKGDLLGVSGTARTHALSREPAKPAPQVDGAGAATGARVFEHPSRALPGELVGWQPVGE